MHDISNVESIDIRESEGDGSRYGMGLNVSHDDFPNLDTGDATDFLRFGVLSSAALSAASSTVLGAGTSAGIHGSNATAKLEGAATSAPHSATALLSATPSGISHGELSAITSTTAVSAVAPAIIATPSSLQTAGPQTSVTMAKMIDSQGAEGREGRWNVLRQRVIESDDFDTTRASLSQSDFVGSATDLQPAREARAFDHFAGVVVKAIETERKASSSAIISHGSRTSEEKDDTETKEYSDEFEDEEGSTPSEGGHELYNRTGDVQGTESSKNISHGAPPLSESMHDLTANAVMAGSTTHASNTQSSLRANESMEVSSDTIQPPVEVRGFDLSPASGVASVNTSSHDLPPKEMHGFDLSPIEKSLTTDQQGIEDDSLALSLSVSQSLGSTLAHPMVLASAKQLQDLATSTTIPAPSISDSDGTKGKGKSGTSTDATRDTTSSLKPPSTASDHKILSSSIVKGRISGDVDQKITNATTSKASSSVPRLNPAGAAAVVRAAAAKSQTTADKLSAKPTSAASSLANSRSDRKSDDTPRVSVTVPSLHSNKGSASLPFDSNSVGITAVPSITMASSIHTALNASSQSPVAPSPFPSHLSTSIPMRAAHTADLSSVGASLISPAASVESAFPPAVKEDEWIAQVQEINRRHEEEIYHLEQRIVSLTSMVESYQQMERDAARKKTVDEVHGTQINREEIDSLKKKTVEQENLILGYQRENERLFEQTKELQQSLKRQQQKRDEDILRMQADVIASKNMAERAQERAAAAAADGANADLVRGLRLMSVHVSVSHEIRQSFYLFTLFFFFKKSCFSFHRKDYESLAPFIALFFFFSSTGATITIGS